MGSLKLFLPAPLVLAAALAGAAEPADSSTPAKSACNFFNPVPENLMRELNPDRPDKTESPCTLDAGHFMLEMDFANYTYDRAGGGTTRAWNVAPFNLKAGLFNNVDLQFVFDGYEYVRTAGQPAGKTLTRPGIGDFTARLKINLWGDDGGKTAFALLPFLKIPTGTDGLGDDAVEGGVIFPFAVKLPHGFDLGLETAFGCLRDDRDGNHHADFINSVTLGHNLAGKLGGYVEFFSDLGTERHSGWVGTVDTGLEYLVTENLQLDCGCNFGVTRAADDFNPFAGITVRF